MLHQFNPKNCSAASSQHINKLLLWVVHQKMKEANSDTFSAKYTCSFIACGWFLQCLNQKHPYFAKKRCIDCGEQQTEKKIHFQGKQGKQNELCVKLQQVRTIFRLEVVTEARIHLSELLQNNQSN